MRPMTYTLTSLVVIGYTTERKGLGVAGSRNVGHRVKTFVRGDDYQSLAVSLSKINIARFHSTLFNTPQRLRFCKAFFY